MGDSLILRLHQYLVERFSLYAVLVLGLAHVYFLMRISGGSIKITQYISAIVIYLGFLIVMRFLDEFKDKDHDDEYYADRPVQRGLITLKELSLASYWVMLLLLIVTILTLNTLTYLLFVICCVYLYLMRKEFFIRKYLRQRLMQYLVLHQVFSVFLSALIISIFGVSPLSERGAWVVAISTLMILSIEIARKVRAPGEENRSKDTYSAYLGRVGAALFWEINLLLIIGILIFKNFVPLSTILVILIPLLTAIYYLRFTPRKSEKIFLASTALTLFICMGVAIW